jgi:hypothetical protein
MGKRFMMTVYSLGMCAIASGLIWLGIRLGTEGKSQARQSDQHIFPHIRVNQIARDLSGADEYDEGKSHAPV